MELAWMACQFKYVLPRLRVPPRSLLTKALPIKYVVDDMPNMKKPIAFPIKYVVEDMPDQVIVAS